MKEEMHGNTVSVLEFLNVIRRYKGLILALPIVVAAFSVLLAFIFIRPTWEASSVLEIGHVWQPPQTGQMPIEPVTNVVARMQHPSFATAALSYANVKPDKLFIMQSLQAFLAPIYSLVSSFSNQTRTLAAGLMKMDSGEIRREQSPD